MSDPIDQRASPVWRSAVTLTVIAALCTTLVALTYHLTRDRILDNEQAYLEESLKPVLAGIDYDGELSDSTLIIDPPHSLPGNSPVTVYRVYAAGEPIAALFVVTTRNGYSGPIKLLVGVDASGVLNRARVLEHRETPGLGDQIETGKSDWMEQFNQTGLSTTELSAWAIVDDGGEFDALTGASITSRAVVNALRDTLAYFAANRSTVFAPTPSGESASLPEENSSGQ